MMVYNLDTKPFWKSEVDDIDTVKDISKKLPWFLECNPDRFPYWWVEHSCDNILSLLDTFHISSAIITHLQVWETRSKEQPTDRSDAQRGKKRHKAIGFHI